METGAAAARKLGGPGVSVGNSQALPRNPAPGHYGSPLRQPWAKFSTFRGEASSARDDDPVPFQRAMANRRFLSIE